MKKVLAILLALVLCCAVLTGCGEKKTESQTGEQGEQIVNPLTSVASLDELNSAVGCALKQPAGIEVNDAIYTVIAGDPETGEYAFECGGVGFIYRAAKAQGDISGVYTDNGALGETVADGEEVQPTVTDYGCWARWFDGDMQYCLYSSGADAEQFGAVYNGVR